VTGDGTQCLRFSVSDQVALDMMEPWRCMGTIARVLKTDGCVAVYLPKYVAGIAKGWHLFCYAAFVRDNADRPDGPYVLRACAWVPCWQLLSCAASSGISGVLFKQNGSKRHIAIFLTLNHAFVLDDAAFPKSCRCCEAYTTSSSRLPTTAPWRCALRCERCRWRRGN
jgi:hypothetical protein